MIFTVKKKRETLAEIEVPEVVVGSSIDLRFKEEKQSRKLFTQLKQIMNCCHVGKNAPKGPYVAIYPYENKGLQFLIN